MEEFFEDFPEARPVHLKSLNGNFQKETKLFVGQLFTIHGTIPHDAHRFSFNLISGGTEGDFALHADSRFGESCVVRNSRIANEWLREEREGGLPLTPGTDFEMMVAVEEGHYKIAFNGHHFGEFTHRIAPVMVDTVSIVGDVNVTSYQVSMRPPPFGLFGVPIRPIQSDGTMQCFEVHKGMKTGRKVHIGGVALGDTFIVDFKENVTSKEEIGLHISCRVAEGLVVFNSMKGGAWQEEVRVTNMPFASDRHFDLLIASMETGFSIVLNGSSNIINFFPFRHIKEKKLKVLVVHGSVKVNYVTSVREK